MGPTIFHISVGNIMLSRVMTSTKGNKIVVIALSAILMLSGILCLFTQVLTHDEEILLEISEPEPDLDDGDSGVIAYGTPYKAPTDRQTRWETSNDYLLQAWEYGHGTNIGQWDATVTCDIDNDGILEIVFGNAEGYIHILQHSDGEYIDEWKSDKLGPPIIALAVGDVDSDGESEIVAGTDFDYSPYVQASHIHVLDADGEGYSLEWSFPLPRVFNSMALATGDVDNDDIAEIIVGVYVDDNEGPQPHLRMFGFNGASYSEEWNYTFDSLAFIPRRILVNDVDDDGTSEFIVATGEIKDDLVNPPLGYLYIFGPDTEGYAIEWDMTDASTNGIVDVDIGDADNDGNLEIAVGGTDVYIYQYNGAGDYTLESIIPEDSAFVEIGDVNHDGLNEAVTGKSNILESPLMQIVNSVDELETWITIWEYDDTFIWNSLWTSDILPGMISSIRVNNTDTEARNEILLTTIGSQQFPFYGIWLFEFDGAVGQIEWDAHTGYVECTAVGDVYGDSKNEILFGTNTGEILIFEFNGYDYEHGLTLSVSEQGLTHILIEDFDNDGVPEIAAVEGDTSIRVTETSVTSSPGDYSIFYFIELPDYTTYIVQLNDLSTFAVDTGDVDGDGVVEIVAASCEVDGLFFYGYLAVIGYVGTSPTAPYEVLGQSQISDELFRAVGVGDTDQDGTLEIVVNDLDNFLYVVNFDGSEFATESIAGSYELLAIDVADCDNDGLEEILGKAVFHNPLVLHRWNGSAYTLEAFPPPGNSSPYNTVLDDAFEVATIHQNGGNVTVLGEFDLAILDNTNSYQGVWESKNISINVRAISVDDVNSYGGNELVASLGGYLLIYTSEDPPTANLSVSKTTGNIGEVLEFDGSMSKGAGNMEYFFDFGDGENSNWLTDSTTTHSYSEGGAYTASLKVRDSLGESSNSADVRITVNHAPTAVIDDISPNPGNEGGTVNFFGHGEDFDGTIISYSWSSDIDDVIGEESSFSIVSLSAGTHTISFSVKDNNETWSQPNSTILVIEPAPQNQAPIAYIVSISPNPSEEGEDVSFSGYGVDYDGEIVSYSWESDIDGVLSNESSFGVSSLSQGTHIISFKVKDDIETWSQPNTTSLEIKATTQNQAPMASIDFIGPNPAKEGETVTFMGLGTDEDGTIISYSWESDIDGLLSTEKSFSTSDMSVGEHTIIFKVKDDMAVWSEPDSSTLVIEEKKGDVGEGTSEGESNEGISALILATLGIIALIIVISVVIIGLRRSDKTGNVTMQISCPGCSHVFDVASSARPLNVQCPGCGLSGVLDK